MMYFLFFPGSGAASGRIGQNNGGLRAVKGEANLPEAGDCVCNAGQILAARGFDGLWAKACAAKEAFPMP